jgi:hypothetical protein
MPSKSTRGGNRKSRKDSGPPLDQKQQGRRGQTDGGGPKGSHPDKHGGSGAGRQQGGSGPGRER